MKSFSNQLRGLFGGNTETRDELDDLIDLLEPLNVLPGDVTDLHLMQPMVQQIVRDRIRPISMARCDSSEVCNITAGVMHVVDNHRNKQDMAVSTVEMILGMTISMQEDLIASFLERSNPRIHTYVRATAYDAKHLVNVPLHALTEDNNYVKEFISNRS